jgi:vacuolar-type H+-ATPase subunit H
MMSPGDAMHAVVAGLDTQTRVYDDALTSFLEQWSSAFSAVQSQEIDPLSGALPDLHLSARGALNSFLFDAEKRLTAMRGQLEPSPEGVNVDARFFVLQSDLVRGFQALQQAHHHFAFAAGGLDTRENFRLDSALNRARGLRRRTQERIRRIEEHLERQAAQLALEQFSRDREDARARLNVVREEADAAVQEMVALQDGLNLSAGMSEQFLRALVQVELAKTKVRVTQGDLFKQEEQLRKLAAEREANHPPADQIEVVSVESSAVPLNWTVKLRAGIIAGTLTLVLLLAGQRWMIRLR